MGLGYRYWLSEWGHLANSVDNHGFKPEQTERPQGYENAYDHPDPQKRPFAGSNLPHVCAPRLASMLACQKGNGD